MEQFIQSTLDFNEQLALDPPKEVHSHCIQVCAETSQNEVEVLETVSRRSKASGRSYGTVSDQV